MPTSHYFPLYYKNNNSEQNLYQDLVDEQIKLFGSDVYYISKKVYKDNALNDIVFSEFSEKIVIETMLQNVEGFGPQSEFISKFGLRVTDEVRFTMSVRRWEQESSRLNNLEVESRPNEGDLIYFPLTGDLYEIKFVERESPFYQLGKLYFFTLTCEIYVVGSEDIETGIPEIDDIEADNDYSISLVLQDGEAGTGDFYVGDTIEYYGSSTAAGYNTVLGLINPTGIKAEVADWDAPSKTLKLINVTGEFTEGYYVGKDSAQPNPPNPPYQSDGIYQIADQVTTVNIDDSNSDYDDNKYIEIEADEFIDWSEDIPFGVYGNYTDTI